MEHSDIATPRPVDVRASTIASVRGRSSSVAPETPTRYHNSQYGSNSKSHLQVSEVLRAHSVGPETVSQNLTPGAAGLLLREAEGLSQLHEAEELTELEDDPEAAEDMDDTTNTVLHGPGSPTESYLLRQKTMRSLKGGARLPTGTSTSRTLLWPRPLRSQRAIISPKHPSIIEGSHEYGWQRKNRRILPKCKYLYCNHVYVVHALQVL
jgi:hypothetical protein